MRSIYSLLIIGSTVAPLGACTHHGQAMGDIAIGPMFASRTTVLKVDNRHDTEMSVFAVTNGQEHYLGTVAAKQTRAFALDPAWLATDVSFTTRLADNSDSITRGPFHLEKGNVVEYLIPARSTDQTRQPAVPSAAERREPSPT